MITEDKSIRESGAILNSGNSLYLYFISGIAILGGVMFGFDIAIISGAVPFIQSYFNWSELELGWGVSSLLLGAIVGSLASGYFSDKFGRKKVLIVVALFFAVSCLGSAWSYSAFMFIVFRIIGGLAVGAVSVISPIYVAEVVPSKIRGSMVSIYQLAITFGILISYLINYYLHDWDDNWRWMFMSGVIPSVIFFTSLFFIPESPRWLYLANYNDKALEVLQKIYTKESASQNYEELTLSSSNTSGKEGFMDLFNPRYKAPVLLGLMLAVLVQTTGINTVIEYTPKILLTSGVEIESALLQTSLIGILNFLFTFIAIGMVDKVGRKPLYLTGSILMAVALLLLSLNYFFAISSYLALAALLFFIVAFASCIGPVFWTVVSEISPSAVRGQAMALTSFTQWVFNFLVVLLFPYVLANLGGSATFLILAIICIIQIGVVSKYLPETKGKSLEEIEEIWK